MVWETLLGPLWILQFPEYNWSTFFPKPEETRQICQSLHHAGALWVLIKWGDNSSPIRYPNPLLFPLKAQAVLQLCKEDGRLLGGSVVKNPPARQEMWVPSLGWGDPLEKGYSPWGCRRVRLNSATKQQQTTKEDRKLLTLFKQENKYKSHILIRRQGTRRILITKKKSRNKTEPHQSVTFINWWALIEMPM